MVVVLLVAGTGLFVHARGAVNQVALASQPKGVTVVTARQATFRSHHRYVGTIEPWVQARIGPQLVSGYVDTVLVRPGARVTRGQVIATLDCRHTSAARKSITEQAHALERSQAALAKEAARVRSLLNGGYASPDEVEMKTAESESKQAQLLSIEAQALGSSLQVGDCILRAPFEGEVAERLMDPGAFTKPGDAIATVVDRSLLRITADVPEEDFDAIAPKTPIRVRLLATGRTLTATISRRAPSADASTRTVHFEADVQDPERLIPTGTTAEIELDAGEPVRATAVPLSATSIKNAKAQLFVVANDIAHFQVLPVLGEEAGEIFVDPSLTDGSWIVREGRTGLADGDRVAAKLEPPTTKTAMTAGRKVP
jgi:RND family efflux transporter MFP subunit